MKNFKDLIVQRGRLINNAPNGVTGIQRAAQIKKEMKRAEKISMMSEAMYQAEIRADLTEKLMERK